jgi:hypothetical protein
MRYITPKHVNSHSRQVREVAITALCCLVSREAVRVQGHVCGHLKRNLHVAALDRSRQNLKTAANTPSHMQSAVCEGWLYLKIASC